MGIVKGVLDEVANKHLHSFGWNVLVLQHVGIDLLKLNLSGSKLSTQRAFIIVPSVLWLRQRLFRMVLEMHASNGKVAGNSGRWTQEATGVVEKTSGGAYPQRCHEKGLDGAGDVQDAVLVKDM